MSMELGGMQQTLFHRGKAYQGIELLRILDKVEEAGGADALRGMRFPLRTSNYGNEAEDIKKRLQGSVTLPWSTAAPGTTPRPPQHRRVLWVDANQPAQQSCFLSAWKTTDTPMLIAVLAFWLGKALLSGQIPLAG